MLRQSADTHDYDRPLPEEVGPAGGWDMGECRDVCLSSWGQAIDAEWAETFLNPPIFQDAEDEERWLQKG